MAGITTVCEKESLFLLYMKLSPFRTVNNAHTVHVTHNGDDDALHLFTTQPDHG